MCEFKVFLKNGGADEKILIIREIVAAKQEAGDVILMNILGNSRRVEGAAIESFNTMNQELILVQKP